jgi:hypothetical protein
MAYKLMVMGVRIGQLIDRLRQFFHRLSQKLFK